nr:CPBP family intramembrane glutamic endopeptidase [Calothrix rhizosoleniae]
MVAFIDLWESSANNLFLYFENASVLVVVITFFLAWVGCWLPIATLIAAALDLKPSQPLKDNQKLPLLLSLYLLAPLIVWNAMWLTNSSFADYGFLINVSLLFSLFWGFTLGVLSLVVIFSCQIWLDWCKFQPLKVKQITSIVLPILLIGLLVGGIEELVFRGFLLTQLGRDYPIWLAAIISSLIFALLHLVWEKKETVPQLPGLWLMGMVLVLARLVNDGNLGIAWGLHSGWVWAIGCIDTAGLINYTGNVPEWVTGKNKKPLAGVTGFVCMLLTGLILWSFFTFIATSSTNKRIE